MCASLPHADSKPIGSRERELTGGADHAVPPPPLLCVLVALKLMLVGSRRSQDQGVQKNVSKMIVRNDRLGGRHGKNGTRNTIVSRI